MCNRMLAVAAFALAFVGAAAAQDTVKIGLILPMTGPFASTGRQIDGAVQAVDAAERHRRSPARRSR